MLYNITYYPEQQDISLRPTEQIAKIATEERTFEINNLHVGHANCEICPTNDRMLERRHSTKTYLLQDEFVRRQYLPTRLLTKCPAEYNSPSMFPYVTMSTARRQHTRVRQASQ